MASARSRRDSTESTASLWERLPKTKKQCLFDNNEKNDSTDEDLDINIDDLSELSNNSSVIHKHFSASSNTLNKIDQTKSWEILIQQNHLIIIININENKEYIFRHFLKQGLQWKIEKEEISSWYFGLNSIQIHFEQFYSLNIMQLIFSPISPPFWLTFKKEQQISLFNNIPNKLIRCSFTSNFIISLRFGALISLNQFCYSDQHSWENKQNYQWSLCLLNKHNGNLQWIIENSTIKQKKQLFITNINHIIIFDILNDGFEMYICQKCNMNEYNVEIKSTDHFRQHRRTPRIFNQFRPKNNRSQSQPRNSFPIRSEIQSENFRYKNYCRIGTQGRCYFPTVQFSLRANSSNKNKIQQTFSLLNNFFHLNKITICYGKINSKLGPNINSLIIPNFPTHITRYSWQILSSVGYHLQIQMNLNEEFREKLLKLSKEKNNGDELFYRICVYLSRIYSLKPFVDINTELDHAENESRKKRDQSAYGMIRKLQTFTNNQVYIPSVTLTPTIIKIKPLKLCQTNRILRENKQFGEALYHFILVDIRDEDEQSLKSYHFKDLRHLFLNYLNQGFTIMDNNRIYKYLHHSQSQLRAKQFWFYYHDKEFLNLSFSQAYTWMGNFQHETNVAKYAARMAQCFSTTKPTVQVPAKNVLLEDDIKTEDGLLFTDGCGTMSIKLRNKIQESLHYESDFSTVQFRYGGAKGVVSIDPRMCGDIDLVIRYSMKKFKSLHECFEVCKVSAPRPLYLNRQVILLLSYRKISNASFLILQQQNHLALIRALLRNSDAEKLILENIPHELLTRDVPISQIDFIHEPFFRQILISSCLNGTRDLLRRTRIRIPPNEGRNMIGIVDEYKVLKEGQVFIQYTLFDIDVKMVTEILDNRQVVITKNPCHHPGDIRTFTAIDHPLLRHLKDVVVFSQQGKRPAPHEISGSDLDGDEYFVIWHKDLVPCQTVNASPYNYDSQVPNRDLGRPVTRDDINNVILDIAEQDYIGRLSNLHLVYAVRFSVDSKKAIELASVISQEVDSTKTGFHPLTDDDIKRLNNELGTIRPDFMENYHFKQEKSDHILGKLYRSSRRILPGWNRFLQHHRHLRYLQIRIDDKSEESDKDEIINNDDKKMNMNLNQTYPVNIDRTHPEYINCIRFVEQLSYVYRQEMLEILNLYELSHECDLWCKNSNKHSKGELEDSAYTELKQLIQRTRDRFYHNQIIYCENHKCNNGTSYEKLCRTCEIRQRCLAVACYDEEYTSEQAPILSLPWLFAAPLLRARLNQTLTLSDGRLSKAMKKALRYLLFKKQHLVLKSTTLIFQTSNNSFNQQITVDPIICAFIEILQEYLKPNKHSYWPFIINQFIQKTLSVLLSPNQQIVLELHKIDQDDLYVESLYSIIWKEKDELMHEYFENILNICFNEGRKENKTNILKFSENIILLLQKVAINETIF